jgi:hypothetical protein
MAWQKRGNHHYYYRSKKEKGQVITEYLGSGSRAHQAALEDQARHTARTQERQEQQAWEALESQIAALDTLTTLLSQSLLVVDGGLYRHNRGEWRKRRTQIDRPEPLPTTP